MQPQLTNEQKRSEDVEERGEREVDVLSPVTEPMATR